MNTPEMETGLSPEQLEAMERLAKQEGSVQQRETARVLQKMNAGKYAASGDGTGPSTPEAPGLRADDSMSEAGRKVMAYYFARMLSHEEAVRQGDNDEAVHDMRVATRRLRSALQMFEPYFR